MNRRTVLTLKTVAPLAVLGVAGLAAVTMIRNRPPVEVQSPVFTPPGVRVEEVTLRDIRLSVTSQGTVRPRTVSQLVSEIAGRVTWVAPSFAEGGFFESGDVLVTIDPFDYQQAVVSARSQLAQARLRLAQEEAEAEVAVREWDALGRGDPRALTLRKPQLEEARASVAGAEAGLERAERDLERADIVAPYAGRVRRKDVDIGQFVRVGDAVATIYAVDVAEVRLPLPDEQLAFIDLPLSYRGGADQPQPRVTLRATFAGEAHEWQARIVRTESEIDPVSRMVHAVAEVVDPYAPGPNRRRPPLAVGMYVEAEIAGRTARGIAVVPRAALRGRDQVLVVDAEDRLSFREVDILRATKDAIYVQRGLADGDLVVVSPLDTPTEGMRVQLANADADLLARRRGRAPAEEPAVTTGVAVRALDGDSRMARAATDDAPALPVSEASAPAPDSALAAAATAPAAAEFDIDPSLSRDEQIAAIRRQLALLRRTPTAPPTRTTPDVSPGPPAAAPPRVADTAAGVTAAEPDTAAGTRGRDGAGARVGRGAREERRGRGGREARGVGERRDRSPATPAAPSATRIDERDTLTTKMVATVRAAVDDGGKAPRTTAARDPVRRPDANAMGLAPPADVPAAVVGDAAPGGATTKTLVVLPFDDFRPGDESVPNVDLGAAVTDAVADSLAELAGVIVVSSDDGPAWIVGGGVQRIGSIVRVTARLIDVETGTVLQAVKVDGTIDALAELHARVASALSESVHDALSAQDAADGHGAAANVAGAGGGPS